MSITNLESVTFGIADFSASRRFWTDFGLTLSENKDEYCYFRAQDNSSVILRASDDPALPKPVESESTLREVTFGVGSKQELREIGTELNKDRDVNEDSRGIIHAIDPLGFAVAFEVSKRHPVTAPVLKFNTPGRPDRINTRAQFFASARPLEMTHTDYLIDDPSTILPFYTERLGFVVTDSYPGRGYFMRGGASNHHHDLFLLNVGSKRGYHHVAFELSSIHELFGGGLNMTRRGWKTALGPGRHPISSCYFWYFHCPSGGAAEYDFDSDLVDDNWLAKTFEQSPENFAEWCLAEGMEETLLYQGVQTEDTIKHDRD